MKRRTVPVALWRRVLAGLSPTAIAAGEVTGWTIGSYRSDRDEAYPVFDETLKAQVAEIVAALTDRHGEASLEPYLADLCIGVDPSRRPIGERYISDGAEAEAKRRTARRAVALAEQLRRIASVAEVVAVGLELRAEDHAADQKITDLNARHACTTSTATT